MTEDDELGASGPDGRGSLEEQVAEALSRRTAWGVHRRAPFDVPFDLRRREGRPLVVIFPGLDRVPGRHQRAKGPLLARLDASILRLGDTWGPYGSFLLAEAGGVRALDAAMEVVRASMTVLGVPADRVWLSGTSKGGSTALCAGMALGFGRVLVGEPYVSLGELLTKYASSQVVQGITLAITGRAEPPDRAWGNDIVPSRVRAGAPRFAGTVRVLCCRESGFWDEHVSALPPAFEAGGLAPERWTVEMVPGTAHGHIRVPYEEALAAELRAAPDAPPAGGGTEGPD